ncbi:MAG: hypothetical protein WCK89_21370, partial [bacterium]
IALLSAGLWTGTVKEPGDRTQEHIISHNDPQSPRARQDTVVTEKEAVESTPLAVEEPVSAITPQTDAQ